MDKIIRSSPNGHYLDGCPICELGEKRFRKQKLRFYLINDMQAAAPGMYYLAGEPKGFVIVLTWSSGIGLRYFLDGKMVFLDTEAAHATVSTDPLGPICGCGKRNHAEALFGGDALAEQVRRLSAWRDYLASGRPEIKPLTFLDRAYLGDEPWAVDMYDRICGSMGAFLSNQMCLSPHHATTILWKGTVARCALSLPGIEEKIRQAAWIETVADTPFAIVPGDEILCEVNDDTFIGCGIEARRYLGLAA